jgi:hypothetical protein
MHVPIRDDLVVGVTAGRYHGGGHLYIAPKALTCRLGSLAKRVSDFEEVSHTGGSVQIYVARLVPPWFNVSVLVDDGTRRIRASVPRPRLRRLVTSLQQASFDVQITRTWLDRGRISL